MFRTDLNEEEELSLASDDFNIIENTRIKGIEQEESKAHLSILTIKNEKLDDTVDISINVSPLKILKLAKFDIKHEHEKNKNEHNEHIKFFEEKRIPIGEKIKGGIFTPKEVLSVYIDNTLKAIKGAEEIHKYQSIVERIVSSDTPKKEMRGLYGSLLDVLTITYQEIQSNPLDITYSSLEDQNILNTTIGESLLHAIEKTMRDDNTKGENEIFFDVIQDDILQIFSEEGVELVKSLN